MAEYQNIAKLYDNILYYCDNHEALPAETVSTNKFRWMCRGHTPVYLFAKAKDEELAKYHHGVSKFLLNKTHTSN